MNKEQIDKVLQILIDFKNERYEDNEQQGKLAYTELLRLLGIDENYDVKSFEDIEDIYPIIMRKIEEGDYDYFSTKLNSNEEDVRDTYSELMCNSSKIDDKKNIIDNGKKIHINPYIIASLIKSINKPEYTKQCIDRYEKLGLTDNLVSLIESVNDQNFLKECILLKSEELGLDYRDLEALILNINEQSYINEILKESANLKLRNFQISRILKNKCSKIESRIEESPEKLMNLMEERINIYIDVTIRMKSGGDKINELIDTYANLINKIINNENIDLSHEKIMDLIERHQCLIKKVIENADNLEIDTGSINKNDNEFIEQILQNEKFNLLYEEVIRLVEGHESIIYKNINMDKIINTNTLNIDNIMQLINIYLSNMINTEYINANSKDKTIGRAMQECDDFIQGRIKTSKLDINIEDAKKLMMEYNSSYSLLLRMTQKNNDLLERGFDVLGFIEYFGEEKANLISCYPEIMNKLIALSKTKISILANCISYYEEKNKTEEWTPLLEEIIYKIENIDENLLQQILQHSNQKEINMENLIHLLINSNNLQITTIEEFNNYEEIHEQKCNEMIESNNIIDCKNAIIEKAFKHGLKLAETLVERYGSDIDEIEDESLKMYIIALKEIVNLNDIDTLRELYKLTEPSKIKVPNIIGIAKLLKMEYAKLYNKELFKVKDAVKNDELGENIYEAGTDFSMLMTAVGAFNEMDNTPENFYEGWNRPKISTQHFCCSYIRNDMIRTAPIKLVCYGFERISEDSLGDSSYRDMSSNSDRFVSKGSYVKYYSPNNQINNTEGINEMDIYRMQEGKKVQPDYIIVFKVNGQIEPEKLQYAKQAQKDFGGKLPIVIVDVDKCLESERRKVDAMIADYKANPTPELLEQIKQKIKNNNLTCTNQSFEYTKGFCTDVDIDELEDNKSSIIAKMKISSLVDREVITKHVQGKSKIYSNFYAENGITKQVTLNDIVDEAERDELTPLLDKAFKIQTYNNQSESKAHGVQHIKNVLLLANFIGKMAGLSKEDLDILREAAIYHDVCHKKSGDPEHAEKGAEWYLKNVAEKNKEVAFLIAAHELNLIKENEDIKKDEAKLTALIEKYGIGEKEDGRKEQLIKMAKILQDADRLDILRYDIENPDYQRFDAKKLNNPQNANLIEAVIELNTRQSIDSGYLHITDDRKCKENRFVTVKDLQECYKSTTPEEIENVARVLAQRINQIDLVQDR